MKLEELKVYQLSMDIGEKVWNIVIKWDYFTKDEFQAFQKEINNIGVKLNNYIKSIGKKPTNN
jgi:hypothetical protein